MNKLIPIAKPQILKSDIKLSTQAIKRGWNEKHLYYVNKFENDFKKKISSKFAIATSSCTGAITLALSSLKMKKGSEIILSNINWIATVSPIVNLGFKPVFCDIDQKNWCISPDEIKKKITRNTSAIIITHLYGNLCDIENIKKILKRKSIYLIEDAAEALGSKKYNKYAGTFGDFGCFSFHASKLITTGEGGMLVTNNKKFYQIAKKLSNHGRSNKNYKSYIPDEIGHKFKMTNPQAALGISQLKRLDKLVEKKREIFSYYKKKLNFSFLKFNNEEINETNSYWLTSLFVKKKKFNFKKFRKYMLKNKVDVRNFFPPLSTLKMFKTKKKFPNSKIIFLNSFNLPSHLDLKKNEQNRIIFLIKNFFKKK